MKYFTVLVKTRYSRSVIEQLQKNILAELKKAPEFKVVKARILNASIKAIGTNFEIAIWPLNEQRINQKLENYISSKIHTIFEEQFILSIEIKY